MFCKLLKNSLLTLCFATASTLSHAQGKLLESGKPIKNGSANGVGQFASPSLTGLIMGLANVDNDEYPDLFIQSDSRAPGTYLYYFKKLTVKGEPVFSQGVKVKLPFKDTGENRSTIVETAGKQVFGFWRFEGKVIKSSVLNKSTTSFDELKTITVNGLPRGFSSFGVVKTPEGKYLFLFTVAN